MEIIDKRNTYIEVDDVPAGEVFETEYSVYLKIEPFYNFADDECNCVDLITNRVRYIGGEVKIIKGAFVVGEK